MLPLTEADFSKVRAVFTDVDGTLTVQGRLTSNTLRAIEWLVAHQVDVVLVSGRPSGWGECWARQLPVAGVIAENGGVTYLREGAQLKKRYAEKESVRKRNRTTLLEHVNAALAHVHGARLSMDSIATEVNIAIDYAEAADLDLKETERIESFLAKRGVTAVRSSVHVNCWLGGFDKRTAVEAFLKERWQTSIKKTERRFVYVGDSFNDEPLFKAFPLSVGVANIEDIVAALAHAPTFVTRSREGKGFGEVADAVARAVRSRKGGR